MSLGFYSNSMGPWGEGGGVMCHASSSSRFELGVARWYYSSCRS